MDNVNCNLSFPFLRQNMRLFHGRVSDKIIGAFLSVLHKRFAQKQLFFARFRNFSKFDDCFNFFNGNWQY